MFTKRTNLLFYNLNNKKKMNNNKKISQFSLVQNPTNLDFLAGYRDNEDPNSDNENIRIKIIDLQKSLKETNNTGFSLIVDAEDLKLKKLIEGFGINLVSINEKLELSVKEDDININNTSGVLSLNKGGLGKELSIPQDDGFLMSVGEDILFIKLGEGFSISGDEIIFTPNSALSSKGDLLTRNNSSEVRLPIGPDGTVLKANSSEPSGLKWEEENIVEEIKPYETANSSGYLFDLLDFSAEILKEKLNDKISLSLNQESLDLSLMNNNNSGFINKNNYLNYLNKRDLGEVQGGVTIDFSENSYFEMTLLDNVNFIFTNVPSTGAQAVFDIVNSGNTISWPNGAFAENGTIPQMSGDRAKFILTLRNNNNYDIELKDNYQSAN